MKRNHAKAFATKAHQGQVRKNSSEPYITHPIRVGERLEKEGCSDALISAGYLHDVVEDTKVSIEDIEQQFGKEVATLLLHIQRINQNPGGRGKRQLCTI